MKKSNLQNQSGFITIDFLFSFVLVFGFIIIMFSITLTLSVVSVTQYLTFASARQYFAAHFSVTDQEQLARQKFQELAETPAFKPLYSGEWFEMKPANLQVGDMSQIAPQFTVDDPQRNQFWGVRTPFVAKMLDIKIPFYGSTANSDTKDGGFTTFIGSYLMREVTSEECNIFMNQRWQAIINLNSAYSSASAGQIANFEDNGC
jgi:hypothetical protein